MTKILVTGATGNVGSEVAQALLSQGVPVRLAGRDPVGLRQRFGPAVEAVPFIFGRPETYADAFAGIDRIFLMRPPQITNIQKEILPALDAAIAAGVRQVVFLSLIGIEKNRLVPHYRIEQYLRNSGCGWTFLRASFFMQNLNTTHRAEIRDRSEIDVPVGGGKTSFIDARDIGAVASLALVEPGHASQVYDLTGPEALDYNQVAEQFTQALGRRVTYRNPSVLGYIYRTLRAGRPLAFALVTAGLYSATRSGMAARVTGDVRRLLGREPIPLWQYIQDYRACWT